MPTPLHFKSSHPEKDLQHEVALQDAFERLRGEGVVPEHLVVVIVGPNDMVFGEMADRHAPHTFITSDGDAVKIKNPKRLTRHNLVNRSTGELANEVRIGDFDFISEGEVEIVPQGGFFLDWLDLGSQLRYCSAYLGYIMGKRRAAAEAVGIKIAAPGDVKGLVSG